MSPRLLKSALFAAGVHGALFVPLGVSFYGPLNPQADVLRGTSSVELELVSPEEPGAVREPAEEPGEEAQAQPLPPTGSEPAVWEPGQGALGSVDLAGPQNLPPIYPRLARVNGWQGTVVLRVGVSAAGGTEWVRVRRSSGFPALDQAALRAVKEWRFRPAVRDGAPAASQVEVPVRFRLDEKSGDTILNSAVGEQWN